MLYAYHNDMSYANITSSKPSGVPRIRKVEGIPLRLPFARAFTMAAPHQPTRAEVEVYIVRIWNDDGLAGIGETQAWRRQGSGETLEGLHAKLTRYIAPMIEGRRACDVASTLQDMADRFAGGLYLQAAVGDALYDLHARELDQPLHDILGGRSRPDIPVGIALSIAGDVPKMIEAAEEAVAQGYRHLRIKIGLDVAQDAQGLEALRKHFGDDVVLRADANGAMNYGDSLRLLRRIEPLDLDIVEQPLPGWDLQGMAQLARSVRVPLSADESLTDTHSLLEIARLGAARVVQTKSAKNGGIHAIRKLWTLAEACGIGIFPGNHPSTSINVAAVAQLAASWPCELLAGDFQTGLVGMLAEDIVEESVRVEGGRVQVPSGPGLGVTLDEEKIRRFRIDA